MEKTLDNDKRVVRILIYHYYKNVRKRDIYKILKDNNL